MYHIKGHGYRSAKMLKELGFHLSQDEFLAIRFHMSLKDKKDHPLYENARHCHLRFIVHNADGKSANMYRGSNIKNEISTIMKEEEKKQLFERIEKRTKEVSDENGNISFENFLKLTKEFFGQYSPNGGKTIDEYLVHCTDADFKTPEPESETTNADDLPF